VFIISGLAVVLEYAVVWHLWRTRLLPLFPFLAAHLMAIATWNLFFAFPPGDAKVYALAWGVGSVITTCSLVAAFLETVSRSLEHYPGISARIVWGACGVIAAISAVLGALEPVYDIVRVLLVVQRVSGVAVAVGAIGLALALNYLDPRRRPNVIRHERIMASMAATTALSAWMSNHDHSDFATWLLQAGNLVFPSLWIWALQPAGEADPRPPSDATGLRQAQAAREQLREYYEGD